MSDEGPVDGAGSAESDHNNNTNVILNRDKINVVKKTEHELQKYHDYIFMEESKDKSWLWTRHEASSLLRTSHWKSS